MSCLWGRFRPALLHRRNESWQSQTPPVVSRRKECHWRSAQPGIGVALPCLTSQLLNKHADLREALKGFDGNAGAGAEMLALDGH